MAIYSITIEAEAPSRDQLIELVGEAHQLMKDGCFMNHNPVLSFDMEVTDDEDESR